MPHAKLCCKKVLAQIGPPVLTALPVGQNPNEHQAKLVSVYDMSK